MILSPIYMNVILMALLAVAVWTDHRHHRIPNWLSATTLVVGICTQTALSGFDGFAAAIAGMAVGFAIFLLPYLKRAMAAGDVKLMAAVGTFLGPQLVIIAAAVSLVAGAAVGLVLLSRQASRGGATKGAALLTMKFPYASAIAIGTAAAIIQKDLPWMP
jgi:prepilin peptidase CpaA